ncbi:iron ABC transporter permease [Treponema denticola]|uniref:Iron ABC transporter permease n=1 Tax=Treponema denticola TaxID=158 RepID=A0A9Q9EYC5_TREDN|nr:iron ABC transporter permease [Treponema denticola]UTC89354.1 iron ABC transporter permease [Treponema denticola]UTD01292.1 iron ABC transporter permease [Treponema denticola]
MFYKNKKQGRDTRHERISRPNGLLKAGCLVLPLGGLIFFLVLLSFFLPLILSFVPLFSSRFDFSHITGVKSSFDFLHIFRIAAFTVSQAFFSAALACAVGFAAAYFCARKNFRGRKFLMALSSVPLCVPAIIVALSFIIFFGNNGILNSFLKSLLNQDEPPVNFVFSMTGVIIIHGFYNFPLAMKTISQVWERLSEDEPNAALLLGASKFRIFKTITFPALLNSIAVSFLLIFLFCFFSFIIILLFGGLALTTLEVELYKAARTKLDMNLAAKIALTEISAALILILIYSNLQKKMRVQNENLKGIRERTSIKGFGQKVFFSFTIFIIILFLIAPLFSIFLHSTYNVNYTSIFNKFFYFKAWKNIFLSRTFWTALWTSIKIGILTALVSLIASLFFAYITVFYNRRKIYAVPYLPLAVSSVMLGFGWLLLKPNGTELILIFAQSSLAWPFAWTQIQTSLLRIPQNIINAAVLLSPDKKTAFFKVIVPLCKKGIFSALAFVFAISAGDASLPIVLNIPRFNNLALLIFDYASSYRFVESSAVAVVLSLMTGFVFFLQEKET